MWKIFDEIDTEGVVDDWEDGNSNPSTLLTGWSLLNKQWSTQLKTKWMEDDEIREAPT